MSERRVQARAMHPLPLGSGCRAGAEKPFLTRAKKEKDERRRKKERRKEKNEDSKWVLRVYALRRR